MRRSTTECSEHATAYDAVAGQCTTIIVAPPLRELKLRLPSKEKVVETLTPRVRHMELKSLSTSPNLGQPTPPLTPSLHRMEKLYGDHRLCSSLYVCCSARMHRARSQMSDRYNIIKNSNTPNHLRLPGACKANMCSYCTCTRQEQLVRGDTETNNTRGAGSAPPGRSVVALYPASTSIGPQNFHMWDVPFENC